jgi:hypothetical protein
LANRPALASHAELGGGVLYEEDVQTPEAAMVMIEPLILIVMAVLWGILICLICRYSV